MTLLQGLPKQNYNQRQHQRKWCWKPSSSLKTTIVLIMQLHFGLIKAGDECCKTGRIYSGRNECYMLPNVNSVEPDRVSCLLQTIYCCLHYSQKTHCQQIGLNFIQNPSIQDYLATVVKQENHSIQINGSGLWHLTRSHYRCSSSKKDVLCCSSCALGFTSAMQQMIKWPSRKIPDKLIQMNLSEFCSVNDYTNDNQDLAFTICCEETIKAINSSIRWCDLQPAACAHHCHEARYGSSQTQCSCWEGYRLAEDGKNCVDIDECSQLTHDCNEAYESCFNIEGGYQCLPKVNYALPRIQGLEIIGNRNECSHGFYYNSTQDKCKDIDECASSKHDCNLGYQVCINKIGSYKCVNVGLECPNGFRRLTLSTDSDTGCRDIDECREGLYNCDYLCEDCENTIGSYICEEKSNKTIHSQKSTMETTNLTTILEFLNNEALTEIMETTSCPKGYHFVRSSNQCEDINECLIGQHNCNLAWEVCINFPGTFVCRSNAKLDGHQVPASANETKRQFISQTIDKDEANITLVDCKYGYILNEQLNICEDINECRNMNSPCPDNSFCQNTFGGYICHCKSGFNKDQFGKCKDIDECVKELSQCPLTMRCVNTPGSFDCVPLQNASIQNGIHSSENSCEENQVFDPIKQQCIDDEKKHNKLRIRPSIGSVKNDDKCKFGERMINGRCAPVVCGQGFFYNETDKRCQDMNECLEYSPCRSYEKCTNTIGSYRCSMKCNRGYRMNPNGHSCEDIDECALGIFVCPTNKVCKNRIGSYLCDCLEGFALRNGTCQDINECEQGDKWLCEDPVKQTCVNTIGSYRCRCKDGYQEQIIPGTSKIDCIDIDECQLNGNHSKCEHYCHNYVGSFSCSCRPGYKLANDGFSCIDEDECQMFQSANNNSLKDIHHDGDNSVDLKRFPGPLCFYECVNVPGSFYCACPNGYISYEENICQDIDECQYGDICNDEEFCLNIRGGYRCIKINCPKGYSLLMHKKQCILRPKHFLTITLSDLFNPLFYSYSYISIVSNIRIPKSSNYFDLVSISSESGINDIRDYNLQLIQAKPAKHGIEPALIENFIIRRPTKDQFIISLTKPLQGPQDVELELDIYPRGTYNERTITFIYIVVSEYEF